VDTLSDTRITYVKYEDGEVAKITDDWKDPVNTHNVLETHWQGATTFSVQAKASVDVKVEDADSFEPTPKPTDWLSGGANATGYHNGSSLRSSCL